MLVVNPQPGCVCSSAFNMEDPVMPLAIPRSPLTQTVKYEVCNLLFHMQVETEVPFARVAVKKHGDEHVWECVIVGTGFAQSSEPAETGIHIDLRLVDGGIIMSVRNGSKSVSGKLVQWGPAWNTAARILLPATLRSVTLEPGNNPCGYVKGLGVSMRGEQLQGSISNWHAHNSDTLIVKDGDGHYLYQVLGHVAGVADVNDSNYPLQFGPALSEGPVTSVLVTTGDVVLLPAGVVHRIFNINSPGYKLVYAQGIGEQSAPEGFMERYNISTRTNPKQIASEIMSRSAVHEGNPLGAGGYHKRVPSMPAFLLNRPGPTELQRLATHVYELDGNSQFGRILRLISEGQDTGSWHLAKGEFMFTITQGSWNVEVKGTIFSGVTQGADVSVANGLSYLMSGPQTDYVLGVGTACLKQADTILVHEGSQFRLAGGSSQTNVAVANCLPKDSTGMPCLATETD